MCLCGSSLGGWESGQLEKDFGDLEDTPVVSQEEAESKTCFEGVVVFLEMAFGVLEEHFLLRREFFLLETHGG